MSEKPLVLILSGFLGSGKTTLLVKVIEGLREQKGNEFRIAIIENEIGSASVDSSIIQDAGYSVTEMLSGCVCCTLVGQLVPALDKLATELNPSLMIIEATGMATPENMADTIMRYGEYPTRIVSLVDASRWQRIKIPLRMLLLAQLEPADVICINKIDLVDDDALALVDADVREINATAPLVHVSAQQSLAAETIDVIMGV